jgi:hypothetical protein
VVDYRRWDRRRTGINSVDPDLLVASDQPAPASWREVDVLLARIRRQSNGQHRIRTCEFHRVRMVREPENDTPQALTVSIIPTFRTEFKGCVH